MARRLRLSTCRAVHLRIRPSTHQAESVYIIHRPSSDSSQASIADWYGNLWIYCYPSANVPPEKFSCFCLALFYDALRSACSAS